MYDRLSSSRTQIHISFLLVFLMLNSIFGTLFSNLESDTNNSKVNFDSEIDFIEELLEHDVVFLPNLDYYTTKGESLVKLVIITTDLRSLSSWQETHGFLIEQESLRKGEKFSEHIIPDVGLQHRYMTLPGWIVGKLETIPGVLMVMPRSWNS